MDSVDSVLVFILSTCFHTQYLFSYSVLVFILSTCFHSVLALCSHLLYCLRQTFKNFQGLSLHISAFMPFVYSGAFLLLFYFLLNRSWQTGAQSRVLLQSILPGFLSSTVSVQQVCTLHIW